MNAREIVDFNSKFSNPIFTKDFNEGLKDINFSSPHSEITQEKTIENKKSEEIDLSVLFDAFEEKRIAELEANFIPDYFIFLDSLL